MTYFRELRVDGRLVDRQRDDVHGRRELDRQAFAAAGPGRDVQVSEPLDRVAQDGNGRRRFA